MNLKRLMQCKAVNRNNGIFQVLLSCDEYTDQKSQPEEWLINLTDDIFQEGDEWIVRLSLMYRGTKPGSAR